MNLFSMTKKELQDFLVAQGMKKFRADQIFHYIYKQSVFSWDDMVLLPQKDRDILKEVLPISMPEVVSRLDAPDGRTVKLLLRLEDGQTVETVLMMHDYGNSICVSSQVGCAVNCAFCASAKNGFVRNLSAGEMVTQLLAFRQHVTTDLHSIVIMGTGEPLLNYDNVIRFMKLIHEKDTFRFIKQHRLSQQIQAALRAFHKWQSARGTPGGTPHAALPPSGAGDPYWRGLPVRR